MTPTSGSVVAARTSLPAQVLERALESRFAWVWDAGQSNNQTFAREDIALLHALQG